MAETISIMCSRITKPWKVSAPTPVIFITLCLIENFLFALSCAWPGNYHLKWPACSSRLFFLFFLCSSWKYDNDFNRSERCVFLATTFFKLWMARRESWREQQPFFFPPTLFWQNNQKKEREREGNKISNANEIMKKRNLKQQQEAIDNSCLSIYFLTL